MANYATTSGLQATSLQLMSHIADIKFKKVWENLIAIMTVEFAAAVTGQDGYAVTSTLVASLENELINLSDFYHQKILRIFFNKLAAEFALAGDGTMFNYTVTSGLLLDLKEMVQPQNDVLKREALMEYCDLMFTEFTAIATAS